MSKGNHIIRAIGAGADSSKVEATDTKQETVVETVEAEAEYGYVDEEYDDASSYESPRLDWIVPAIAIITVLAWTGLYAWAISSDLANAGSASPAQWMRWIIDWSVPVLLVAL